MANKFHEPWVWYWAGVLWHSREAGQDALQDAAARTIFADLGELENPIIEKPLQLVQDLDEPNGKEMTQAVWTLARFYALNGRGLQALPTHEAETMNLEVTPNGIRKVRKSKVKATRRKYYGPNEWPEDEGHASPF